MEKTIDHRPFSCRYRTGSAPCLQLSARSDSVTQLLCRSLTEMKRKILEREVCTEKEKSVASRWIRGRGLTILCLCLDNVKEWHAVSDALRLCVCVFVCGCASFGGSSYTSDVIGQSIIQQQCRAPPLQLPSCRGCNTRTPWSEPSGRESGGCREG